jgi:chorismate-pyruvate lyase
VLFRSCYSLVSGNLDFSLRKKGISRQDSSVKESIVDISDLETEITGVTGYLNINEIHEALLAIECENEQKISDLLKVLLASSGSMTQALQAIQQLPFDRIKVKTLNQVIVGFSDDPISEKIFEKFMIPKNEIFIFRKVVLHANHKGLVLAISFTPLCNLSSEFQDELMEAKEPIGFLLEKYKIEVARRISRIGVVQTNPTFQEIFGIQLAEKIPFRIYDLINNDKIFMKIIEFFNPIL